MSAHHVPSLRSYVASFVALLVLTGMTVAAAYVDLGAMSTLVAITIAGVKALIVALWFMHLRATGRLTWVFAASGVAWFLLLVVLMMADFDSRAWLPILR
jgi:cytochrome c oxidase subunit 4